MAQGQAEHLLQLHCGWALRDQQWSSPNAKWLYALAARIDKPASASMCAQLRSLLRHCAGLLSNSGSASEDLQLPEIHLIMAIAGAYFRQDDSMIGLCRDEYD